MTNRTAKAKLFMNLSCIATLVWVILLCRSAWTESTLMEAVDFIGMVISIWCAIVNFKIVNPHD